MGHPPGTADRRTASVQRSRRRVVAALAAVVVSGGCSNGDDAAAPSDEPTISVQEQQAALASEFGLDDPPPVEVVRVVTAEARGPLVDSCLEEAGYSAEITAEQGVPLEQVPLYEEAQYRCLAAYPVDPRYTKPFGEQQIRVQYAWTIDTLIPCLQAKGYDISDPPSEEVFVAAWATDPFFPFSEVPADSLSNEQVADLNRDCPQEAPSELLYP